MDGTYTFILDPKCELVVEGGYIYLTNEDENVVMQYLNDNWKKIIKEKYEKMDEKFVSLRIRKFMNRPTAKGLA